MKNSLERFKNGFKQTEERNGKFEDGKIKIIMFEEQKDKRLKKSEYSLRDQWDIIKWTIMHIVGVQEGREGDKGAERILE